MADVIFKEGTSSAYSKITPDSHTFYHITDTDQVYLGSIPLINHLKAYFLKYTSVVTDLSGTYSLYWTSPSDSTLSRLARRVAVIAADGKISMGKSTLVRDTSQLTLSAHYALVDLSTTTHTTSTPIYLLYYE